MQDEKEFRDKLSPIFVSLNFSMNPQSAADMHGLRPILNYQTAQLIEQKVRTRGVTNIPQCLAAERAIELSVQFLCPHGIHF